LYAQEGSSSSRKIRNWKGDSTRADIVDSIIDNLVEQPIANPNPLNLKMNQPNRHDLNTPATHSDPQLAQTKHCATATPG